MTPVTAHRRAPVAFWRVGRFLLDVRPEAAPLVMGIVNVTPDSFSDGGRWATRDAARAHCEQLVAEGAALLDIGGESTRPGARSPAPDEELERVLPVVEHAVGLGVAVSVDTSAPEVMRAALAAGADLINDVRSLRRPGALEAVAAHPSAGVCVMHMQGEPGTMQTLTDYPHGVLSDVRAFLDERLAALLQAGVAAERVALDPGIGFAKTPEQNAEVTRALPALAAAGQPLLLGWSRKSSLGLWTGRPVGERLAGSLAAALACVAGGARVLRVHDVAETVDALKVWAQLAPETAASRTPASGGAQSAT